MLRFFLTLTLSCYCLGLFAQTEVTSRYIKNPSFETGFDGWIAEGLQTQSNNDFPKKAGSLYVEKWVTSGSAVGNASVKQQLTGLPAGRYQMVVGAQNLQQKSASTQCAGACIFAGETETSVYGANDYSVEFTNLMGIVQIGFRAVNAQGNWIAVDNFRLYRIDDISSQELFDTLSAQISIAESLLDESMDETIHQTLSDLVAEAKSLTVDSPQVAMQAILVKLVATIDKARFAIALANATPGSGTAPKVTTTNKYVVTGATEALMRASFSGSNILERGICWSTEHNPTVLCDRTTDNYSLNGLIFHVKGLCPASVYYFRPYVINKTYTVAYGDEVKVVTHAKGNCKGTWDGGAPDAAANTRCKTAIEQTIAYFNEWTGIQNFTLSGHYGAQTPTADCSYGGWMRIGPNAGNQAIGTVIHETGHGVGVGTSDRWWDTNYHDWRWKGREANKVYQFLENKEGNADYYMVGDKTHGWGEKATYDWFVNGADKDMHTPIQYIGGCALLYGLFIDGLCPTSSHPNGVAGYTYNYEDTARYYIMSKNPDNGLNTGLICVKKMTGVVRLGVEYCLNDQDTIPASAAFHFEFDPASGKYRLRSAVDGKYVTHGSSISTKKATSVSESELFQLIPDRTDVTLTNNGAKIQTHGYWFTWYNDGNKAIVAPKNATGPCLPEAFSPRDIDTKQQWIILTEEEIKMLKPEVVSSIRQIEASSDTQQTTKSIYNILGQRVSQPTKGIYIINGKKTLVR